ncbi:MAG: hypothetical protein ABI440_14600 [Casimicrobiaceae bacterium]
MPLITISVVGSERAGVDPERVMPVFLDTQWENWAFDGGRLLHADATAA